VSAAGGVGIEETEIRPDVAATANGGFVVAWARGQYAGGGSEFYTFVRRLDSLGLPNGQELRTGRGGVTGPRLDATPSGGFQVVWSGYEKGDFPDNPGALILVKAYDAAGTSLTDALPIGDEAAREKITAVAFAGGQGLAVTHGRADELVLAWTNRVAGDTGIGSDGDGWGVFGTVWGFGTEIRVDQTSEGDQITPDIATRYYSEILAVWEGDGEIYGRRLAIDVPDCADTDQNGSTTVRDALFVLQAALGSRLCELCVCDADGSRSTTASDALAVLREAVGTRTTFRCPVCDDPFARTFALQSDASCYGAHVELRSLPDYLQELGCKPNPLLEELGCEVAFDSYNYYPGAFDARGGTIGNVPLFTCHLSEADARQAAATAEVSCGCGCADTCPNGPQICTDVDGRSECSPGASMVAANAAATVFTTITQAQPSVTSSTTCGTCCDYYVSADVELADQVTLSELLIRFRGTADPECQGEVQCSLVTEAGGPGYIRVEGDTVEMCLSDRDGITGPLRLGSCEVLVGDFDYGAAEIVRALDQNLEPVTPAPAVLIEQY